jgi:hypothetical protein
MLLSHCLGVNGESSAETFKPYKSRCEPSQNGGFFDALHWQRLTLDFSVISSFLGWSPVPLWEPSQNGLWLVRPQEHHQ